MATLSKLWKRARKRLRVPEEPGASSSSTSSPPPPRLCPRCRDLDLASKYGFCHHNFEELRASALSGRCALCLLFYEPYRTVEIRGNPQTDISIIRKSGKLAFKIYGYRECLYEIVNHVQEVGATGADVSEIVSDFRLTNALPLCERNIALVNQWIMSCCDLHEQCRQESAFAAPTRLLSIEGMRLRLCSLHEASPRYAALSYCWGAGVSCVTTSSSIEQHSQQIEWSSLPATFQDAIVTSQKLGINYLWIDSLCIIQDSRVDWENECQRTGDYYKNAHITLSSLDSSSTAEGFLRLRKHSTIQLAHPDYCIRPTGRPTNIIFGILRLTKEAGPFKSARCLLAFCTSLAMSCFGNV